MLAQEPQLQFVGTQDLANNDVVGTIVAKFIGTPRQSTAMSDDDLMGIQKTRDLHGNFFPAARRTLNAGGLSNIGSHGDRDSAEQLNALGNQIHQFDLLVKVFIK